ncbi:hypothetical protein ADUPG1_000711, partial [Aduncisulcus paluster]
FIQIITITPKFIHEGSSSCIPIPRDDPLIIEPDFDCIEARNLTYDEHSHMYDQSFSARKMLEQDYGGWFTHVFIPFFPSNRMKASNGKIITSKKFKFPELTHKTWYYLPIDLFDVSMCVIEGKGRRAGKEDFILSSLIFIREETPEESITRKIQKYSLEKLWTDSPLVLAESLLSKKVKTYA